MMTAKWVRKTIVLWILDLLVKKTQVSSKLSTVDFFCKSGISPGRSKTSSDFMGVFHLALGHLLGYCNCQTTNFEVKLSVFHTILAKKPRCRKFLGFFLRRNYSPGSPRVESAEKSMVKWVLKNVSWAPRHTCLSENFLSMSWNLCCFFFWKK